VLGLLQVTGDPRRPDEAVPFERPKGEDAGDIMLVVAVVVGAASLLFKVRPGSTSGFNAWLTQLNDHCHPRMTSALHGQGSSAACHRLPVSFPWSSAALLERQGQREQRCCWAAYARAPCCVCSGSLCASQAPKLVCVMLQWQLGGWAALICTLQAIANMKTKDWDIKQVISAMT
jgi:Uncharacterised protein family (UPF0139)